MLRTATQHPQHEIERGNGKAFCKLKVGDRVWIGEGQHPCTHGIKLVTRVTPTLILVGAGKDNWERFKRSSGFQIGKAMFADYISGVATEDEIHTYELKMAQAKAAAEQLLVATAAMEAKQKELMHLFSSSQVFVSQSSNYDRGKDVWSLQVSGLTEAQVRSFALFPLHVAGLLAWLSNNQTDLTDRTQVENHTAVVRSDLAQLIPAIG